MELFFELGFCWFEFRLPAISFFELRGACVTLTSTIQTLISTLLFDSVRLMMAVHPPLRFDVGGRVVSYETTGLESHV